MFFLEKRGAFFVFFERNKEEESSGEAAIFIF